MVRICDSSGCSNRSSDSASYSSSNNESYAVNEEHLGELKILAEKDPRAAYDLALRYFRGVMPFG